jgi:uncharacterized ParB-like nuclease family protein
MDESFEATNDAVVWDVPDYNWVLRECAFYDLKKNRRKSSFDDIMFEKKQIDCCVIQFDGTSNVLHFPSNIIMSDLLKRVVKVLGLCQKDNLGTSIEIGEKPNLLVVEMDLQLAHYATGGGKRLNIWLSKKTKTFTTKELKIEGNTVLTYQICNSW